MSNEVVHPCFLSAIIVIMQLSHSLQVGLLGNVTWLVVMRVHWFEFHVARLAEVTAHWYQEFLRGVVE